MTTSTTTRATRRLLSCGLAAGPIFLLTTAAQAVSRDGFDLTRHPISLLALGDAGWIQVANFVLAGLLVLAAAAGVRRVLHPGRAGTWGPLLVGVFGVGLLVGGIFATDPVPGFPIGAAVPAVPTWHSVVHDLGPGLALDATILATIIIARRFIADGERAWAGNSLATGLVMLVLSFWPSLDGISVRLAVAVALAFVWVAALAARLRRDLALPIR